MKPKQEYCRMYCADYPTCHRSNCSRAILFEDGITKLVEKPIYDYHRKREKMRAYREPRLTKMNF